MWTNDVKVYEDSNGYAQGSYQMIGKVEVYTYTVHETTGTLAEMNRGDAATDAWQVVFTTNTSRLIYDGYSDTWEEVIEKPEFEWQEGCDSNIQEVFDAIVKPIVAEYRE